MGENEESKVSYGRVYIPSFQRRSREASSSCGIEMTNNNKILSKVVRNCSGIEMEIKVGKIIREKIKDFHNYFNPILDVYKITGLSDDFHDQDFCLLKIKNIGSMNFDKYMHAVYDASNDSHYYFNEMLIKHKALLVSISFLVNNKMTHMDLSSKNILFDSQNRPIIKYFGLTIAAGHSPTTCAHHPLEFGLINHIKDDDGVIKDKRIGNQEVVFLKKIVENFISENPIFHAEYYTKIEEGSIGIKNTFRKKWNQFLSSFVNRHFIDLYQRLMKEIWSWDNYGLAANFHLASSKLIFFGSIKERNHSSYRKLIQDILFFCPSSCIKAEEHRLLPEETLIILKKIKDKR
jgi:hypothetical protein